MLTLTVELVMAIHDEVLNPGELSGLAQGMSLDGALARVENRLAYGMIVDIHDLAAAYAMAIARGHCFNDGNKRTAFRVMNAALMLNGLRPVWHTEDVGQVIIRVAQGQMDDGALADWLRAGLR